MERIYSQERPRLKEVGRTVNPVTHTTLINFDVQVSEDKEQGNYSYLQLELYPSQMNKAHIINAIIRSKYQQQDVEAIQNNYLADMEDIQARQEFGELQQWRAMAKNIAKEVLDEQEK